MRSGLLVEAELEVLFFLKVGVLTFWYEADGWSGVGGVYVRLV